MVEREPSKFVVPVRFRHPAQQVPVGLLFHFKKIPPLFLEMGVYGDWQLRRFRRGLHHTESGFDGPFEIDFIYHPLQSIGSDVK